MSIKHESSQWVTRRLINESIEAEEADLGRKMDREEVMRFLFGDSFNSPDTELDIAVRNPPAEDGLKVWQRLNHLWVMPICILIVCPVTFFVHGRFRLTGGNWFTRFLMKAVGQE